MLLVAAQESSREIIHVFLAHHTQELRTAMLSVPQILVTQDKSSTQMVNVRLAQITPELLPLKELVKHQTVLETKLMIEMDNAEPAHQVSKLTPTEEVAKSFQKSREKEEQRRSHLSAFLQSIESETKLLKKTRLLLELVVMMTMESSKDKTSMTSVSITIQLTRLPAKTDKLLLMLINNAKCQLNHFSVDIKRDTPLSSSTRLI